MELFEAIEISALKSVLQPDNDYFLRRIFRWYSEKFHTPLHEVPDLPVEDVLQTYFEAGFERMSKQKLNALAKKVTKDKEEKPKKPRKPRKKAEKKLSDDDFAKMMAEKSKEIVQTLEARNEERKKAAQDMMEDMDDMDPLSLPEIHSNFNSNLE